MKKIFFILLDSFLLLVIILYLLVPRLGLTKENVIAALGFCLVILGLVMTYIQLRINLNYNKRKEAIAFSFGSVVKDLQPLQYELKKLLGKQFFMFKTDEKLDNLLKIGDLSKSKKQRIRTIVSQILNFYERMSIAVLKDVLDEDICYDDLGLLLISFYGWTADYIRSVRVEVNDMRVWINFEAIARQWGKRYAQSAEKLSKEDPNYIKSALVENPEIF